MSGGGPAAEPAESGEFMDIVEEPGGEQQPPASGFEDVPSSPSPSEIPPEPDDGEAVGETGDVPGMPEASGAVDKLASINDLGLYKRFIQDTRRIVPLSAFVWDKKAQHGQLRGLQMNIVMYYVQRPMTKGDPDCIFHCWARQTEGVSQSLFLCVVFLHFFLRIAIRKITMRFTVNDL